MGCRPTYTVAGLRKRKLTLSSGSVKEEPLFCRGAFKGGQIRAIKAGQIVLEFWMGEMEKKGGRFSVSGRVQEDRGVTVWVEAASH